MGGTKSLNIFNDMLFCQWFCLEFTIDVLSLSIFAKGMVSMNPLRSDVVF